jgi:hypothetical protein
MTRKDNADNMIEKEIRNLPLVLDHNDATRAYDFFQSVTNILTRHHKTWTVQNSITLIKALNKKLELGQNATNAQKSLMSKIYEAQIRGSFTGTIPDTAFPITRKL